jgi:anti-sigma B factor antagonist
MTTPLTLTPGRGSDGGVILRFAGEIDMTNTGDFAAALADNPGKLVVDLTHVLYLDSAGLSVLFSHADRIRGDHLGVGGPDDCSHRGGIGPLRIRTAEDASTGVRTPPRRIRSSVSAPRPRFGVVVVVG